MRRPSNNCSCCHAPFEGHHYSGVIARSLFGLKAGDTVRDLCEDCYCMLYREFLIDRGGACENIFRGMVNVCAGCEIHKQREISKVYVHVETKRGRKGPQLKRQRVA